MYVVGAILYMCVCMWKRQIDRAHAVHYLLSVLHPLVLLLSRTDGPAVLVLSWYSLNVSPACPRGRYGLQCRNTCSCQNGGLCDPVQGSCKCGVGWTGPHCDTGISLLAVDKTENNQNQTKWFSVHGKSKTTTTTDNKTGWENSSKHWSSLLLTIRWSTYIPTVGLLFYVIADFYS